MIDNLSLTHTGDILDLYGTAPPLNEFRLRSINLNWRGPAITLRVDISSFPEDPPQDWKSADVDTVQCHLRFLAVDNLLLSEWEPPAPATLLRVEPLEKNQRVRVRLTGARVDLTFTSSNSAQVGHVSAFKIDSGDTDEVPHLFLRNLDKRRYKTIPNPEDRTFYERI